MLSYVLLMSTVMKVMLTFLSLCWRFDYFFPLFTLIRQQHQKSSIITDFMVWHTTHRKTHFQNIYQNLNSEWKDTENLKVWTFFCFLFSFFILWSYCDMNTTHSVIRLCWNHKRNFLERKILSSHDVVWCVLGYGKLQKNKHDCFHQQRRVKRVYLKLKIIPMLIIEIKSSSSTSSQITDASTDRTKCRLRDGASLKSININKSSFSHSICSNKLEHQWEYLAARVERCVDGSRSIS